MATDEDDWLRAFDNDGFPGFGKDEAFEKSSSGSKSTACSSSNPVPIITNSRPRNGYDAAVSFSLKKTDTDKEVGGASSTMPQDIRGFFQSDNMHSGTGIQTCTVDMGAYRESIQSDATRTGFRNRGGGMAVYADDDLTGGLNNGNIITGPGGISLHGNSIISGSASSASPDPSAMMNRVGGPGGGSSSRKSGGLPASYNIKNFARRPTDLIDVVRLARDITVEQGAYGDSAVYAAHYNVEKQMPTQIVAAQCDSYGQQIDPTVSRTMTEVLNERVLKEGYRPSIEITRAVQDIDQLPIKQQVDVMKRLVMMRGRRSALREAIDPIVQHCTERNCGVIGVDRNETVKFICPESGRLRYMGRVKSYAKDKGLQSYGFVECPEVYQQYRSDAFLRRDQYLDCFYVGEKISFHLEVSKEGKPQAVDLRGPDGRVTPKIREALERRDQRMDEDGGLLPCPDPLYQRRKIERMEERASQEGVYGIKEDGPAKKSRFEDSPATKKRKKTQQKDGNLGTLWNVRNLREVSWGSSSSSSSSSSSDSSSFSSSDSSDSSDVEDDEKKTVAQRGSLLPIEEEVLPDQAYDPSNDPHAVAKIEKEEAENYDKNILKRKKSVDKRVDEKARADDKEILDKKAEPKKESKTRAQERAAKKKAAEKAAKKKSKEGPQKGNSRFDASAPPPPPQGGFLTDGSNMYNGISGSVYRGDTGILGNACSDENSFPNGDPYATYGQHKCGMHPCDAQPYSDPACSAQPSNPYDNYPGYSGCSGQAPGQTPATTTSTELVSSLASSAVPSSSPGGMSPTQSRFDSGIPDNSRFGSRFDSGIPVPSEIHQIATSAGTSRFDAPPSAQDYDPHAQPYDPNIQPHSDQYGQAGHQNGDPSAQEHNVEPGVSQQAYQSYSYDHNTLANTHLYNGNTSTYSQKYNGHPNAQQTIHFQTYHGDPNGQQVHVRHVQSTSHPTLSSWAQQYVVSPHQAPPVLHYGALPPEVHYAPPPPDVGYGPQHSVGRTFGGATNSMARTHMVGEDLSC